MIHGMIGTCRRFADSTRAVAAIEFAMIMPVLMLLFLGTYDAENAICIYTKVRSATYSLGAITNQYGIATNSTISTSTMTAITNAVSAILAPYSSTPTQIIISQIKATSNSNAVVSWSYAVNATALTPGTTFTGLPPNFAQNSCSNVSSSNACYAIYAQVKYTFTPSFGQFVTGPITLSDSIFTTPRISQCVQYNGTPSSC